MSSTLYWRPFIEEDGEDLPFPLKRAISQKFWGHDGSLSGDWVVLGSEHIDYIEGLIDGGVEGAEKLKEKLHKYRNIEICLRG